jgi:23S rRNA (adenine-N6)-dimethyltransferase
MAPYHREYSRARRAFSQNFLVDPTSARRFLAAAELSRDRLVYEVGAGRGNLTRSLVERAGHVVAYEVDPELAAALPRHSRLTVRAEDFLRATPPCAPFAVVGNIPYSLTSSVVDWCLRARSLTDATLLTQLEYARKRTGDYGRWSRLTILTWPTTRWHLAGRIPRTAFRPAPRVDSGILRLIRRPAPLVQPAALSAYTRFVDLGFTGRGGSLYGSLSRRYGARRTSGAFRATRVGTDLPVGEVWPEQWLTLFRILEQ